LRLTLTGNTNEKDVMSNDRNTNDNSNKRNKHRIQGKNTSLTIHKYILNTVTA